MAALEHDPDSETAADPPRLLTRLAAALTVALLAVVLVVAARAEAPPTQSRTGRRVELVELIHAEQQRTRRLEASVADLASQVSQHHNLEAEGAKRIARLQGRIDRVAAAAGLAAIRGPGVIVTLTDSALEAAPSGNLNDLVIHEQDLQAVINGLWAGGAEAMSVNGQRILATTAIRCVGNTLLLHGGVYSPPYVIRAVGDEVILQAELDRDPAVTRFKAAAAQFKLGFSVVGDPAIEIPASDGAALAVARAAEGN